MQWHCRCAVPAAESVAEVCPSGCLHCTPALINCVHTYANQGSVPRVGELWVSLMEKAYAKLHGCYFALDCGSIADALVDLTGGVVNKLKLDSEEGEELVDSGALWTRMLLYCSWGYVMAAVFKVKPAADGATGPGGLLLNHVYSVVDCRLLSDGSRLVRVHNPWPTGDWQGAWSRGGREWQLPGMPLPSA